MSQNYATEYKRALAQTFKKGLKSLDLIQNGEDYSFLNAKTIQIPNLSMTGFRDHGRGSAIQTADDYTNEWEAKTLMHDRSKYILADIKDIDETNLARSIANLTRVFNEEHKVPEMDAYVFSKIFQEFAVKNGNAYGFKITASNFLEYFDHLMLKMDEAEVPEEGRILYLTPKLAQIAKSAEGLTRQIKVGEGQTSLQRNVYSLDDVKIVKVPASRLKTKFNFAVSGGGFAPHTDGLQVNMLLIHPKSQISPIQLEQALLDNPKASTSGKYSWFERSYWDSFILDKRVGGVQFMIEPDDFEVFSLEAKDSEGNIYEGENGESLKLPIDTTIEHIDIELNSDAELIGTPKIEKYDGSWSDYGDIEVINGNILRVTPKTGQESTGSTPHEEVKYRLAADSIKDADDRFKNTLKTLILEIYDPAA